ncbi:hypothetical protein PHPALM_27883 [Phytophthora palmivora]|uniref:Uncharacterized protein n=1 Tax=Phytophthora palmivora TaxID=4796 RepID=A0A2P4XBH0_9STRA|nr:hypothetical protein PHPALM_27883 [Phytophthora palmivora]
MEVELSVPIKEGRRSSHTRLITRLQLNLIFPDPQLRVGTLWGPCRATRSVSSKIAWPGGQAVAQSDKPGALEVFRQDVDALGHETRELHRRVDHRVPATALKEICRGLDTLNHRCDRRFSYELQGYSYHPAYGYSPL